MRSGLGAWIWPCLALAILMLPVTMTSLPPITDYPNHMARMHVLVAYASDPALRAMFAIHWALIPNMVMDLVVPALARFMPLDVAGRLFLAAAIVLPTLAVVRLHRTLFDRTALWPWMSAVTAYCGYLTFGLLNYLVGMALALFAAAWYLRASRGPALPLLIGLPVWGVVCLVSHLMGFALLAGLLIAIESGRVAGWPPVLGRRAVEAGRPLLRFAGVALAIAVPIGLYIAFGPRHTYVSGNTLGAALNQILDHGLFRDMRGRIVWAIAPFTSPGSKWLGFPALALAAAPPLLALAVRRLRVAPAMLFATAGLGLAYLVLPRDLADNSEVYTRIALPALLVGIAALDPVLPPAWARGIAAAAAVFLVARTGLVAWVWHTQEPQLAELRAVIADIPPQARVLAVRQGSNAWHTDPGEPAVHNVLKDTIAYTHLPAIVTLERDAFWPMIFAAPGKQPIEVRPPYEALTQEDGYLPKVSQLAATAALPPLGRRCIFDPRKAPCQLYSWPKRFDYVLELNAQEGPIADPRLTEVAARGWARLYKVTP